MAYRERDVIHMDVETAQGDELNISVYVGMLPEEMLSILMKQQILRLKTGETEWSGPDEKIQELMAGAFSSTKRSTSL